MKNRWQKIALLFTFTVFGAFGLALLAASFTRRAYCIRPDIADTDGGRCG